MNTKQGSPWTAPALSLMVFPGAGQWANGEQGKAAAFGLVFAAVFGSWLVYLFTLVNAFYSKLTTRGEVLDSAGILPLLLGWLALCGVIWMASGVDAWRVAKRRFEQAKKGAQDDGSSPGEPGDASDRGAS